MFDLHSKDKSSTLLFPTNLYCPLAHLVEQFLDKEQVVGAKPTWTTNLCGYNSKVE